MTKLILKLKDFYKILDDSILEVIIGDKHIHPEHPYKKEGCAMIWAYKDLEEYEDYNVIRIFSDIDGGIIIELEENINEK